MRTMRTAALALALIGLAGCNQQADAPAATSDSAPANDLAGKADNENFGVSYLTGYQIGQNLRGAGLDVDVDVLAQAIGDAIEGKESILTEEQQTAAVNQQRTARQAAMEKQRQERAVAAEESQQEGEAFLAENGQREGVVTTESGLQYEVLTLGEGPMPTAEDRVRVHYAGTLIDDTPFDSSYQRGEPTEFAVTGVIRGWTEGLQLMPVGSKFRFFIPSDLAYGPRDRGAIIKANSTLVFEVELLAIIDQAEG